jgi:hypothetical protein
MNWVLWIVQGVLALLLLAGGGFKLTQVETLAGQFSDVPAAAWRVFGLVEIVGAVLVILPAATGWKPVLTPIAAGVLLVESLVLAAIYARASLAWSGDNPLVYAVVMAIGLAFVAYGRLAIVPLQG